MIGDQAKMRIEGIIEYLQSVDIHQLGDKSVPEYILAGLPNVGAIYDCPVLGESYAEGVRENIWSDGVRTGAIGDLLAVPFTVQEHGNVLYSVSRDVEGAYGVWVPDELARENIKSQLSTAMNEAVAAGTPLSEDQVIDKSHDLAFKYAEGVLEEYTEWVNGNCFGYAVDSFDKDEDGAWQLSETDAVYGFYGDKYAHEEMVSACVAAVEWQAEMSVARAFAAGKAECVPALVDGCKNYDGEVLGITDRLVTQSIGKSAVIHNKWRLDSVPDVGQSVSVRYSPDGRGKVEPRGKSVDVTERGGR